MASNSSSWMAFPARKFEKMRCCWRTSRPCRASKQSVTSRITDRRFSRRGKTLPFDLTVIMANRLPLEQQTGAGLVYFNEAYAHLSWFNTRQWRRAKIRPNFVGDQFVQEVARMDALLAELNKIQSGADPDGYRFPDNPFFLKFCPRVVFNPDDKGLFKGIYLPLALWKRADAAG